MPRNGHIYYVRCVDDTILIRPRFYIPHVIFTNNGIPAISDMPQIRIKKLDKLIVKGHCYRATLFLKDPLARIQLLETERGTLSRRLLHRSGMLRHGVFRHKRFERITKEEYETWRRSKML